MLKSFVSADSHVTEPPDCYTRFIEKKYKDTAPHLVKHERYGEIFVVDGVDTPVPMGLIAAAGKNPKDIDAHNQTFADLYPSGYDPKFRLADQDKDGVGGEFLYPSVGMVLCLAPDPDYKRACMGAYNRWLAEYVSEAPDRLFGVGQAAIRDPDDAVKEFHEIKALGFKGVMMPGDPHYKDYDDPAYDKLWATAVELDLPLSFHISTGKSHRMADHERGHRINSMMAVIRACQDIVGMFIFGGAFDRFPDLKLVCVEADAGWAPHYMARADHMYDYHRYWMKAPDLKRMPSAYFRDNIYMTFQFDWTAFAEKDLLNIRRILWANDFPHSDGTWPRSREFVMKHTEHLTDEERNWVVHDNICDLYGVSVQ